MNEALILEKLDSLSSEIQSLKSEVQTLQQERGATATPAQQGQSVSAATFSQFESASNQQDLSLLMENLAGSVGDLNALLFKVKAANELARDIEPVAQNVYPRIIKFFGEIEEQVDVDELTGLLRTLLTSIGSINEGISMLKMGIELKEDLVPVAQLGYPKAIKFLNDLYQGEFQSEQLTTLLRTLLMNLHTFSDLLNMAKPITELIQELQVLVRETDVITNLNIWLDSLQQSNGFYRIAGTAFAGIKQFTIDQEQAEAISTAIKEINFNKIKPVSMFGMVKALRDPQTQEALGAMFMILQAAGACLQVIQNKQNESV